MTVIPDDHHVEELASRADIGASYNDNIPCANPARFYKLR